MFIPFSFRVDLGIRYSLATPKERCFVEEVTRVTWAVQQGGKVGEDVRPSFSA